MGSRKTPPLKKRFYQVKIKGLAAIDTFLAFHHSKESPVVAILANIYDTFN